MRFQNLDLNLLVALDVLLETQSVTEAARRLHLSQPSVSAALGRMRDFFSDDLLVQVGRRMIPTAKGQELGPAIKEMLNIVRFRITYADDYDPAHSRRRFRIVASDYAFDVLVSRVLAQAETIAPFVSFDISPPGLQRTRQFRDGDVDLMITVADYTVDDHPKEALFTDEDSVICWSEGAYAQGVTASQFLEARHAVAVFGNEQMPTITELHFSNHQIERNVAVRVPSFAALPNAVVGTNRIATMHKRHAQIFSSSFPINIHPIPITGPITREVMQWHKLRHNDSGLKWLIDLLRVGAQNMNA